MYRSGKVYTHDRGLSCCFRQWRATHSHCRLLHGYSLQVEIEFACDVLDARNWTIDFGDLGGLKVWLHAAFDHKTIVAKDDPQLDTFRKLEAAGLAQLTVFNHVGCEAFAEVIFDRAERWLADHVKRKELTHNPRVVSVTVREHRANFARFTREQAP